MFKITESSNGMPCVVVNENPNEREFILHAVRDNYFDSKFYKAKQKTQPFIQCNDGSYLMIEFWGNPNDAQKYVDFLNKEYEEN